MAIGTTLDLEVVHKLDELGWPTVESYWKSNTLYSGRGYDLSPKQPQHDATFMCNLPDFRPPPDGGGFAVDVSLLPRFDHKTAHKPRCEELYTPPLLIIPESPGGSRFSPKSLIVRKQSTVFRKSYYGFSTHGSEEGDLIIALLHLITHADLFSYHVLLTSSRMGAERRTFLKENLENFPFPPTSILSARQRRYALELSGQLEAGHKPWNTINDFIFDLYGLDSYDRQVVKDRPRVAAPFKEARERANSVPAKEDRNAFYGELQRLLAPSFDITDETVSIDEVEISKLDILSPWYFFTIASRSTSLRLTKTAHNNAFSRIIEQANKTGCSRVAIHGKGFLLVGIIGQYRYWTPSRARLFVIDILRHHLDAFPIRSN